MPARVRRQLGHPEKQVASAYLSQSWTMFFSSLRVGIAVADTGGFFRTLLGNTTALHLRRLLEFFENKPRVRRNPRPGDVDDVVVGDFIKYWDDLPLDLPIGWEGAIRDDAKAYVNQMVLHITDAVLDHPLHLPVKRGVEWFKLLAAYHESSILHVDPDDLDAVWLDNMSTFEVTDVIEHAEEQDGLNHFGRSEVKMRFRGIYGEASSFFGLRGPNAPITPREMAFLDFGTRRLARIHKREGAKPRPWPSVADNKMQPWHQFGVPNAFLSVRR